MNSVLEIAISNAIVATGLSVLVFAIGRVCQRPTLMHCLWSLVILKLVTPPIYPVTLPWPDSHDNQVISVEQSFKTDTAEQAEQHSSVVFDEATFYLSSNSDVAASDLPGDVTAPMDTAEDVGLNSSEVDNSGFNAGAEADSALIALPENPVGPMQSALDAPTSVLRSVQAGGNEGVATRVASTSGQLADSGSANESSAVRFLTGTKDWISVYGVVTVV